MTSRFQLLIIYPKIIETHSFERQTILFLIVNTLAHSRDVTVLLNEISLRCGCTIKKYSLLLVYCYRPHSVKRNKICKPRHRLCFTTPSGWIFQSTLKTHERYLYSHLPFRKCLLRQILFASPNRKYLKAS